MRAEVPPSAAAISVLPHLEIGWIPAPLTSQESPLLQLALGSLARCGPGCPDGSCCPPPCWGKKTDLAAPRGAGRARQSIKQLPSPAWAQATRQAMGTGLEGD